MPPIFRTSREEYLRFSHPQRGRLKALDIGMTVMQSISPEPITAAETPPGPSIPMTSKDSTHFRRTRLPRQAIFRLWTVFGVCSGESAINNGRHSSCTRTLRCPSRLGTRSEILTPSAGRFRTEISAPLVAVKRSSALTIVDSAHGDLLPSTPPCLGLVGLAAPAASDRQGPLAGSGCSLPPLPPLINTVLNRSCHDGKDGSRAHAAGGWSDVAS
jgi:hypothetical protein